MPPSRASKPTEPRPSRARQRAHRGGERAEALAALYLRLKFYRILERRFKTPVGEIDLIAERWGTTVFVEVKARSAMRQQPQALAQVNQVRISRAAAFWLARHPARAHTSLRFDVIFLAPRHWPRHHINAFDAP
ncbi:MAG: YraN family protein [Devosia sp.]|nr:YraN family protein [Devosia sp.]